jgi:hypothetical protein
MDAFGFGLVSGPYTLVLWFFYAFACMFAVGTHRIAWLIALTVPLFFLLRGLLLIAVNAFAYATHDLPADFNGRVVISIVVFSAVVFVAPSVVLITLFWRHRTVLRALANLSFFQTRPSS